MGALYPARLTFSTHAHCSHFNSLTAAKERRKALLMLGVLMDSCSLAVLQSRAASLFIFRGVAPRMCDLHIALPPC